MYSVVVLMTLSGGGEMPDLGGRRCNGCNGCSSSCHAYSSCSSSCHRERRCHRRCNGCNSSCHVYSSCGGGAVKTMPGEKVKEPPKPKEEGRLQKNAPATIVVSLPAEAKLMVDSHATTSTSSRRVFTSPELAPNQDFTYTFKAELTREGKTETLSKVVTVRAGETSNVEFAFAPSVAAK